MEKQWWGPALKPIISVIKSGIMDAISSRSTYDNEIIPENEIDPVAEAHARLIFKGLEPYIRPHLFIIGDSNPYYILDKGKL